MISRIKQTNKKVSSKSQTCVILWSSSTESGSCRTQAIAAFASIRFPLQYNNERKGEHNEETTTSTKHTKCNYKLVTDLGRLVDVLVVDFVSIVEEQEHHGLIERHMKVLVAVRELALDNGVSESRLPLQIATRVLFLIELGELFLQLGELIK